MNYEYSDKITFKSSKLRFVTDKKGQPFVRKNVRVDADLAEKLKGISCPYIVKFVEFGEDNDGAYVIEEYAEGVTAAERTFTQKQAVKALLELCEALEELHSAKIIHRDIKPSNLMIAKDGHIRLIDFDASRIEKAVKDKDTQVLGTEGFAPPEQFGFSQTDCRSDIYSFGVTMSMLLGDNAAPFIGIIKKCRALDPNDRYESISKVKSAIKLAMMRKFAAIFAAAVLLAVFTAVLSIVLNNRDTLDHTVDTTPERYLGSSSGPDISQPTSSVSLSENSGYTYSSSDSRSSGSSVIPKSPESSQPPENSEPSKSSELPEIPVLPEKSHTQTSNPVVYSNEFYSTIINEFGYYEDICNYTFVDDESVHGDWKTIATLDKNDLNNFLNGDTDLLYREDIEIAWMKNVRFDTDGSSVINNDHSTKWTKGYIILESEFGQYVCEILKINMNGIEYLLFENKTGDYLHKGLVMCYFVCIRADQREPEDTSQVYPPPDPVISEPAIMDPSTGKWKITYETIINSKGYYEDIFDYRFYDDPSVYGNWENIGMLKKDEYDKWMSGETEIIPCNSWLVTLSFFAGGKVRMGFDIGYLDEEWTNGYLIYKNDGSQKVSEYVLVTIDGVEYLVLENKNGDYQKKKQVNSYLVYTRKDS